MFRQSSSDDEEFERTIPLNQHESMRDSTHNSQVPYLSYHALTETSGRRSQDQTPPSPEEQTDVATSLIQNSHSDSRRAPTVGGSRRVPVVNVVVNNENRDSEPLTLIRADHQISQLSRSDTQTRTPLSDQSPLMDPLGMVTPDVNGQVRSDRASRLSFAPPTSILDPHLTAGGKRTTSDRRMSPPKFPQFAADRREVSFSLGTMGSVHTKRRIGPMQLIREVVIRQDRAASALFRPMNPSDLPPLGTDALQQPSELTDDGAAVLTNYYGLRGRNMDEQQTLEEKDEEPPKDIESMPLRGGIRSVSLFNPFCLTAFIVLIPFIFMIIAFGVSYRDVTDNKDSKQVVRMAQLLNQLVTDLVEEAAAAAALNALAVQRDSYANNLTTFFIMWNVLGNEFQGSQTAADTTISKIGSLIDSYDNEYRLLLGSVSPWAYLDMSALSKARVQASVSTINAYTMTNYDNIINRVLLYYGGLALASFFLVKTDVTQIQSAASLQMLMVVNALYEFLIQKANENNVADLSNVPSNNEELQFIYDAVAALRITERTLRFPSSLDSTVDVTGPGFAPAAMSFINKDSGLFEIQLPPVILETLLSMVALTIDTPTYNGFDPANGEMLRLYINTLNTVIVPDTSRDWMNTIDQINTHRQKVQEACLFVILVLSIVGIVYHVLAVAFFWRRMPVHMRYNHYAQNLRQALERMHNHTLSILRFASSPMIEEQSLVDGSLRRPITIEEHRLCLSALMVQKLEPFLPLPMRLPPPGAPQSALVHGNFFCRPSLFVRDGLVAIHVSFAYIHLKSDDERSATILTLDETGTTVPTENRITQLDLLQTSIHGKKGKKVHRRELNYSKYCRDILHQLCHFSNAHMPHSKTGAFLQQCGDSAMLWLNMCEDIPYPHLTAFSICAAVEEYCLHRQLDVPSMVVGSGSAAVGNIPSFSSVPSTLEPMENYFQVWSKSPFFDPSLDVTAAKPQGATDLTTGDAQNSNHTELLAATANMPTKTRAKFWFRQLLGLKLEVKKQQKSFSSAEIASRTEKEERAALLASTSVDSDDEMTLPEKVSPQYTPDAKSSCLTSCVVYGEVMHEIDALRQLGRIHKEHVVASERAIEQMVAEKQRFDADFESGRAQEMFRSSDEALMDETSKTLPSDPESSNPTSPKGRLNRKDSWMMNNSTSITSKGSKWDSDQQNTVHAFFSADNIPERFRQLDLQGIPMDMYCYARTVTSKSIETVKKKKKKGDSEASAAAPTEDAEEEEEDSVRLLDMDSEDTRFHQYSRRIASKEQTITLTEGVRCNRRARHDMRAAYCLGWRTAAPVEHPTGDGTRRASLSKQRVLSRSGLPSDPTAYDQTIRSWIVLFREYYPFACAVAELEPTNRRLTDSDNRRMTALCLNLQNAIDTYGSNTSTAFLGRSTLAHMQDVLHLVRQCVENGPFSELGFSPFSIQAIEIVLINEAAMM